MKIELPKEEDGFYILPVDFNDVPSFLINPKADAKWNKHNLHFRSLIVHAETLDVLSSGWPKFMNYGEKPDCYPDPDKFIDWEVQEKLDGTLVIVDYINGHINLRTRGTVSYKTQANFQDFEQLLVEYPGVVEFLKKNQNFSLLFELVTPNNVIVIREDKVKFYFLGAIDKTNLTVKRLDGFFNHIIPKRYTFNSLDDIIQTVKYWKGQEGIVLVYNKNQNRVKFKSDWYLWVHRIKSQLNSENNLIELYVRQGLPDYNSFYSSIEKDFDYEVAIQLRGEISKLCDAGKHVNRIIISMKEFVSSIRNIPTRKEQAAIIMNSFGGVGNNRAGMVFTLLDGKELNEQQITKLIHQVKN